jgi:protein-disulfide isomerase
MKKVFFILGIAVGVSAKAQQISLSEITKRIQQKKKEFVNQKIFSLFSETGKIQFQAPPVLSDDKKIVTLPTDNMPCVTPNMNLFSIMPNAANQNQFSFNYFPSKVLPGQIPNGSPKPGVSNPFKESN